MNLIPARLKDALKSFAGKSIYQPPPTDKLNHSGTVDRYFLPPGYKTRSTPKYFDDFAPSDVHAVWQPDVYRLADLMAQRVIDVGCGKGEKLQALAKRHEIIGIDFGGNLEFCRKYPFGTWLEHDLDGDDDLPLAANLFEGATVICADVLEHVAKPTRLLRKLQVAASCGATVILSTPERELIWGKEHKGPPPNESHLREWSLAELRSLLEHAGFSVAFMGVTADNDTDRKMMTSLAVLRA